MNENNGLLILIFAVVSANMMFLIGKEQSAITIVVVGAMAWLVLELALPFLAVLIKRMRIALKMRKEWLI